MSARESLGFHTTPRPHQVGVEVLPVKKWALCVFFDISIFMFFGEGNVHPMVI